MTNRVNLPAEHERSLRCGNRTPGAQKCRGFATCFVRSGRSVVTKFLSVAFVSLLVLAQPVRGQSPAQDVQTDWHFRYELFQMLLEQGGLEIAEKRAIFANPRESVIVQVGMFGGSLGMGEVEQFCLRGGIVLLATDQDYFAGRLGEFRSGPVETPEVADRYQDHRDCLKVTDLNTAHPLVKGVNQIVVNRSGWLKPPILFNSDWNVAARLPGNCSPPISSRQPILGTIESKRSGRTRMVVCADPSLLTNGMMWHGDNAFLAINIARLLTQGRKQLLFVVDNRAQLTYEQSPLLNEAQQMPPLPDELPETTLNAMLRVANTVIDRVDESNVLNEGLMNRPRNMSLPLFRRLLIFILAAIALLVAIWRLASNGPTIHRTMPLRDMKSALAMNADQKLKESELGLSASILAREFCTELTGSADPADWFRQLSGNAESGSSRVVDSALQKRMSPIVDIAVNSRNVRISSRRFEQLGKSIIELRTLHRKGDLIRPDAAVAT